MKSKEEEEEENVEDLVQKNEELEMWYLVCGMPFILHVCFRRVSLCAVCFLYMSFSMGVDSHNGLGLEDFSRAVRGGICRVSWLFCAWILRVSLC